MFPEQRYDRDKGEYDSVPDTVERVHFPWTDSDWCYVAMRERDGYVGGCCGNMSLLQDHINGVFRDGGYADSHDLLTIGQLARDHDGFDDFAPMDDDQFIAAVARWKQAQETL